MGGQINTLADEEASPPTSDAACEPGLGEGVEALVRPKLHLTGKGLSPADYRAKHGLHDHQANFD
ncbi:MAG: MucR family transcriptional regulator [Caulobacteraceae bacterium]|nr:MucR family transcriptional regulator [Caulobacteraceae bacterium]